MKKGLILLFCALLLALLAAGGVAAMTYQSVDVRAVPRPTVHALGTPLLAQSFEWRQPVFGGLIYKDMALSPPPAQNLGVFDTGTVVEIQAETGAPTTLTIRHNSTEVANLPFDKQHQYVADETGFHEITVTYSYPPKDGQGAGVVRYDACFTIEPPPAPPRPAQPTLVTGNTQLVQGDILSLQMLALGEGVVPRVETDLGMAVCTPYGQAGDWFCAVPIGNTRQTGEYTLTVTAGDDLWEVPVAVLPFDFVEQDLTIDITDPVISEANSPAAYQQYRDKIPPLFATFDEERYWEGMFILPAEGRISTEFGAIRYTNGNRQKPSIHWGVDIANAEGTPIVAPGAGRVVLAEQLLNTGNTLVIEHGGGLKSYYFHMSCLDVSEGDSVQQGQAIGAIGSTGYSTGPHLHFEMRIGNQAINPQLLFDPLAGLYSVTAALDEQYAP